MNIKIHFLYKYECCYLSFLYIVETTMVKRTEILIAIPDRSLYLCVIHRPCICQELVTHRYKYTSLKTIVLIEI